MNIDFKASIHNRFDIEVIDAKTGKLKQKCQAFNVICDTVWNLIGYTRYDVWYPKRFFRYIAYGSGTGTPSALDTTLFSYLNKKSMTIISDALYNNDDTLSTYGVNSVSGQIVLNPSDNVGDTITEVGLASSDSQDNTIYTHAMIKDMNGNIISIQKTDTDIINIYATIYVHFSNIGWYNGKVMFALDNPISNRYENRLLSILGGMAPIDSYSPFAYRHHASLYVGRSTETLTSAKNGSFVVSSDHKHVTSNLRLEASNNNIPIKFLLFCIYYESNSGVHRTKEFCIIVDPSWYTASIITNESIGTGNGSRTSFTTKFPIKTVNHVYIDGIIEANVNIRFGPVRSDEMILYFNRFSKDPNGTVIYDAPFYWGDSSYPVSQQDGNAYANTLKYTINKGQETPILENPYSTIGIIKIGFYNNYRPILLLVSASDDLENWIEEQVLYQHPTNLEYYDLPSTMKYKRYWKVKIVEKQGSGTSNNIYEIAFLGDGQDIENNVVFSAPPAVGSVITIDYTPDCIAKDENHVFDFSLSLSFGEQVQS